MSLAQLFYAKNHARQGRPGLRPRRRRHPVLPRRCPLLFEPLEPRFLLSADPRLLPVAVLDPIASLHNPAALEMTAPTASAVTGQAPSDARSVASPELPQLRLVDPDPSHLAGQVFYVDHGGAPEVTYDGPVRVEGIDVPDFRAPAPLSGAESSLVSSVLADLNRELADLALTFTDVRPDSGTEYSTIFLGGDDSADPEEHTSELQSPTNLVCRLLL